MRWGKKSSGVLHGISISVNRNEYVAFMGPSGSGKSTFMNIIGCLDTPTGGSYFLNGQDVSKVTDNQLAEVRKPRNRLYFSDVQFTAPYSALENVAFAAGLCRIG